MGIKVIYFSKTDDLGPGSRYRIFQFRDFFIRRGVELIIIPAFPNAYLRAEKSSNTWVRNIAKGFFGVGGFIKRVISLYRIYGADVVAIEREFYPCFPPIFELLISTVKGGYVLEFDDALYLSRGRKRKYPATVKMASKVIVGNAYLQQFARRYNDETHLMPTCVDIDTYSPKENYTIRDAVKIGWIGLPYNFKHIVSIEGALRRLFGEIEGELCVCSARPPTTDLPVRFVEWELEKEDQVIKMFDIGIMPLDDTLFSRGKCGLKILQYMAAGIPVVASPVGVNKDIVIDGVNGFLAKDDEEWYGKMLLLVQNEDLRKKLGEEGRRTVESKYDIDLFGDGLVSLYTGEVS